MVKYGAMPSAEPSIPGLPRQGTWKLGIGLRRSRFFREAAGTYGTQLIMAGFSLVSSIIVTRVLGPAGRGDYAAAVAIGAIGVQLLNLGLSSSNSYFVAKDRPLLPQLLATALAASFLLGGLGAATLGATFYAWSRAPLHGRLLALSLVWIPFGLAYM